MAYTNMFRNMRKRHIQNCIHHLKSQSVLVVACLVAITLLLTAGAFAKTKLTIMTHTNTSFNNWISSKLAEYTKLHPDIEFEYTIADNAQMDEKLAVMLAAGAPPDIVNVYYPTTQELLRGGYFDLAPAFVLEDMRKNYIEAAWRDMVIDGKVYGYPMEITVVIPVIKEDIYDNNGVAPPVTFDDLVTVQRKLTQTNPDGSFKQLGVNFRSGANQWIMHRWSPLVWGYGADLVDANGYPAFNNPQGIKATEVLKECSPPGALDFLTANTATITQGAHFRNSALLTNPSLQLKALPALRGVDGKQVAVMYHWGTAVPKDGKNKEAAWEFLRWLHSTEVIDTLAPATSSAPTTYSSIRNYQNDSWMKTFIANFEHGRMMPTVPKWQAAEKILINTIYSQVFRGSYSVPEVLAKAEIDVKNALGLQ